MTTKTRRTKTRTATSKPVLFIFDNGSEYSDHHVHYIEAGAAFDPDVAHQAILIARPKGFIVIRAEEYLIEQSVELEPLESFLSPLDFFEADPRGAYVIQFPEERRAHRRSPLWTQVTREFMETLLGQWATLTHCVDVSARACIVEYVEKFGESGLVSGRPSRFSRM